MTAGDDASGGDAEPHRDLALGGRRLRFVADKSFFHDAFRTDYPRQPDAVWLWAYIMARKAVDRHHRILVTSTSILTKLQQEFRDKFPEIPPQVILAIQSLTERISMPTEADVSLELVPLYISKILRDAGTVPVIVSSVKFGKWVEREKRAGVRWGLEGFQVGMSDNRALEKLWFIPSNTHQASLVLQSLDPVYKEVVQVIGRPQSVDGRAHS